LSNKRKQYNPQFKARVALDAVRGYKTVPELASQYGLHPTVINSWKRQLLGKADTLFESGKSHSTEAAPQDEQIAELYRQIGQLKVERDFLEKRSVQLGLNLEKPW
jgi:transposase-like protein